MRRAILAAAVCPLTLGATGWAQEPASDGEIIRLDTIVVTTPLRRASSLERSTSSVTVIGEEEIRKSAALDLPSLLKGYPGISIAANGGMGARAGVALRGTKAAQTLILVNGVRIGAATSGETSVFNIPLSSVQRIEIARGAHSAQYGSDAIGGVINIVTRNGGACGGSRDSCADLTVGVLHPWGAYTSGNVRGQTASGLGYSAGASILGTRGYDFTRPYAPGGVHEPDDDGFLQGSANLSLSQDLAGGRLYADLLFARGRSQYDNGFPYDNEQYTTTFAGKIGARMDHTQDWSSTVELSSGLDYQTNFREGQAGDSRFNTQRYGIFVSTQKEFDTGAAANTITGGVESYRERVSGTTDYDVDARTLTAAFAQYSLEYERLTVDSGVRHDHNSQFGGKTTYNIGASYEILPRFTVRSSFATGFRAPTFNDLYYPAFPGSPPPSNPDLKPEKSRSYEVGVNWHASAATSIDLALYQTRLADAITLDANYTPVNTGHAKVTGFEAELSHRFNERWNGKVSIDVRDPKNRDTGKYLANSDRFKMAGELTYTPTERLSLTGRILYGASRYSDPDNAIRLPDYVTADFTALYALDDRSRFRLSVENIFDEQYETVYGYRAPGRTFDLSFTRSF